MDNKFTFWVKKNGPTLLTIAGIVTLIGDVAITAYQSTKVNATLKPHRERIAYLKEQKKKVDEINAGEIDINAINTEIRKEYGRITLDLMKLYWPTVALTSTTATCFLCSNHILVKREAAAAAALSATQTAFMGYRELVQKQLGADAEKKVYLEATTVETEKEDGTKALECTNKTYDFLYDMGDQWWETNVDDNLSTIWGIERNLNRRLRAEGQLFLIDVYKEFGLNASKLSKWQLQAARVVGWLYDEKNGIKDYISLGCHIPESSGRLNDYGISIREKNEPTILIELHPRGDILTGRDGSITFLDTIKESAL